MLLLILILAIFSMGAGKCSSENTRKTAERDRESTMQRAQKSVQVPKIEHFINRQGVAEYMKRMDDPSKTFYVYLLSYTGRVLGYYVTRTHPISVCSLMTPPDKVNWGKGETVSSAPSLDGLYGGGDGTMCKHYYAFTADTDTLIEFNTQFFVSDQPLNLEADRLTK